MNWLIVASAALGVLLIVLGAWAYQTATRLDRLHVRYDLSWQALDGALARRAVVARAVAIDAYGGAAKGPQGSRLAALADALPASSTWPKKRMCFTNSPAWPRNSSSSPRPTISNCTSG